MCLKTTEVFRKEGMEVMKGRRKVCFWPHICIKKIHRCVFLHMSHHGKVEASQWLQIHLVWHLLADVERKGCRNGLAETESELGILTQVSVSG